MGVASRGLLSLRVHRLLAEDPRARPSILRRVAVLAVAAFCVLTLGLGAVAPDRRMASLYLASALGPTISIAAHDPAGSFALKVQAGRVLQASVGDIRVPREHIWQKGDRVVLVGANWQPLLTLNVSPADRVRWRARS